MIMILPSVDDYDFASLAQSPFSSFLFFSLPFVPIKFCTECGHGIDASKTVFSHCKNSSFLVFFFSCLLLLLLLLLLLTCNLVAVACGRVFHCLLSSVLHSVSFVSKCSIVYSLVPFFKCDLKDLFLRLFV